MRPTCSGANRRTVESLQAQADQRRFELEAARLTLASNVVVAAVQDALLRARIDENHAIIDENRRRGRLVRAAAEGEARPSTGRPGMAAQQATLAQAEAALPPLDKAYRINRDLLCGSGGPHARRASHRRAST